MKSRLAKLRRDLDALRETPAYRVEKLALELTEETDELLPQSSKTPTRKPVGAAKKR